MKHVNVMNNSLFMRLLIDDTSFSNVTLISNFIFAPKQRMNSNLVQVYDGLFT